MQAREASSYHTTFVPSQVIASKPGYESGATAAITLKKPPTAAPKWTLDTADDNELIDEDALLTEEDKQRPVKTAEDDCEVGASGRTACKNCTCGRAEAEAKGVKLTTDMLDNPQSACGNVRGGGWGGVGSVAQTLVVHLPQCGLGDAFRCATCPYKGLPPFEAGKKIQLASDLLTADV